MTSAVSPILLMGTKSLSVSNGTLANTCGLMTSVPSKPSTSVWPSGAAPATACVPLLPPAPGRLSTPTCWPRRAPRRSATTRAPVSVTPPGVKGPTRRIGLLGKSACASAGGAASVSALEAASASQRRRGAL